MTRRKKERYKPASFIPRWYYRATSLRMKRVSHIDSFVWSRNDSLSVSFNLRNLIFANWGFNLAATTAHIVQVQYLPVLVAINKFFPTRPPQGSRWRDASWLSSHSLFYWLKMLDLENLYDWRSLLREFSDIERFQVFSGDLKSSRFIHSSVGYW